MEAREAREAISSLSTVAVGACVGTAEGEAGPPGTCPAVPSARPPLHSQLSPPARPGPGCAAPAPRGGRCFSFTQTQAHTRMCGLR